MYTIYMDYSAESPADYLVTYPEAIYDFIFEQQGERNLAWDVHTGHGKVAHRLAQSFDEVVATEPTGRIISGARTAPNLHYSVGDGTQTDLRKESVNLITVAQAYHRLSLTPFFSEVKRVAIPGSQIAIWGFTLPKVGVEFDRIMNRLYKDTLGGYWGPEVVQLQHQYERLPFPFKNVKTVQKELSVYWSLADWTLFMESWSAVRHYVAQHRHSPIAPLESLLPRLWGTSDTRQVNFTFFVKLGIVI